MKIITISDTHGMHNRVNLPDGDLLIHAGDLTNVGREVEVEEVINWFYQQANRYTYGVVFIAGNHDRSFDPKFNLNDGKTKKPKWLLDILSNVKSTNHIHYLENSFVEINGIKIWGSPITPWFGGDYWAFNAHRGPDIMKYWEQIPSNVDIIVTHGPVMYKLDYTIYDKKYVGCEQLRYQIEKIKPLVPISGPIHEGYGYEYSSDTHYFNASICNINYNPINEPWSIDIDFENKNINGEFF